LGDFGAATIYGKGPARDCGIERLEVLAFAHLVEDMLGLLGGEAEGEGREEEGELRRALQSLHGRCAVPDVAARPTFDEVTEELEAMLGWRGMMRIPN
jgi:hypothetical protein